MVVVIVVVAAIGNSNSCHLLLVAGWLLGCHLLLVVGWLSFIVGCVVVVVVGCCSNYSNDSLLVVADSK